MKYCLSVSLHNLYFDIAIVDEKHNIVGRKHCLYDRSKDVSTNIYLEYKRKFAKYNVKGVGVGVSNNIKFKDDVIYSIKAFNFNRYNLKQALFKLFKEDVIIIEETYAASLGVYSSMECNSLLYVIADNQISNSFVVDKELVALEDDIDLSKNEQLNSLCCKSTLKRSFLSNNLDDDYIGGYFISNNELVKNIIKEWAHTLNLYLEKIVKELKVDKIVLAGYMGEYFNYYKQFMNISKRIECDCTSNHVLETLIGISHLIFKDN